MKKKNIEIIYIMPYRALTHGRVNTFKDLKGPSGTGKNVGTSLPPGIQERTNSQKQAYNSQAGVSNSGSNISQKNKLNIQSGRVGGSRTSYARLLTHDLLIPRNTFGPEGNFVSNQGKGFPTANPLTSVGTTNKFARRAIKRRAVTKTYVKGETALNTPNCKCEK